MQANKMAIEDKIKPAQSVNKIIAVQATSAPKTVSAPVIKTEGPALKKPVVATPTLKAVPVAAVSKPAVAAPAPKAPISAPVPAKAVTQIHA